MTEWTDLTANDFMDIAYIHQAAADQAFLQDAMRLLLDRSVPLSPVDPAADMTAIPYPALLNLIERNIDALTANGYLPSNMLPTRQWLGEVRDAPRLDYADINRWFDSFRKIYEMILGISRRLLITGTFDTGNDKTRQWIRTVNQ